MHVFGGRGGRVVGAGGGDPVLRAWEGEGGPFKDASSAVPTLGPQSHPQCPLAGALRGGGAGDQDSLALWQTAERGVARGVGV